MKLNHLIVLEEAIERITMVTEADYEEIINALTPLCWDEEDAGELKEYMRGDYE